MKAKDGAYVLPNYFYEAVAKELGLPKEIVDKVYRSYLRRLTELMKTEANIYVRKLGTLTAKPENLMGIMCDYRQRALTHWEKHGNNDDMFNFYCKQISIAWKKIILLKPKYEHIERSLEKFRSDLGRLEELFDNEGFYRGNSKGENEDMQDLSIEKQVEMRGMRMYPEAEDEMYELRMPLTEMDGSVD